MIKNLSKKIITSSIAISIAILFSACSKDQILLKTYSPPKKQTEVKQMLEVGDSTSGYLNLEIYDDKKYIINNISSKEDGSIVAKNLIASIKKYITQTNFISINDVADQSTVSLDMKIIQLKFEESSNSINGFVKVEFNIRKGEPIYTQSYKYVIKRYSRAGRQSLPSKAEILSKASDYLAKKLIKDISPLQTQKIVELAPLPSELKYTIKYAKGGNYEGAIKAMLNYKGDKEYEYYFNLALYYEGLASQEDDMAFLAKADKYYNLAMQNGGAEEELVIKGKLKFDNFYKIIQKIAEQKIQNAKENGNSKYELLD